MRPVVAQHLDKIVKLEKHGFYVDALELKVALLLNVTKRGRELHTGPPDTTALWEHVQEEAVVHRALSGEQGVVHGG